MAVQVREDDGLPTPAAQHGRLGQVGAGVVAALGPDVGAQPVEHVGGGVLVEHHDRVDELERLQHAGPVGRRSPAGATGP